MKTNLYVIFDKVAEESGPVFNAVNDGVAMRSFRNMAKDMDAQARAEYQLFRIGAFDTMSLDMEVESEPVEISQQRVAMSLPEADNAR